MNDSELESLLGAYALDAVEPDEALAIEEHLAGCPRCRAEVAGYREVAALLGNAGEAAPEAVWERIADEIAGASRPAPPPLDLSRMEAGASGRPGTGRARRRVRPVYALAAVAAALALVVGILSAKVADLNNQVNAVSSALSRGGAAQQFIAAGNLPHREVTLAAKRGAPASARLLVRPGGTAYFENTAMKALPRGRTYQLWALASGRVVSLGVLGSAPHVVAVRVEPNMKTFMVTNEPEGGTSGPTTPVLAQGTIA
ncbi:MAG: hypothetical protein JWM85_1703 [Acidimicrobiaceae bacterium]|nr:hypothetical protein [Acidimicrobiaceae bacterium]